MNALFRTISTLVIAFSCSVATADVAIIGHPGTDVGSIDANSIRGLFLGERRSFPNGVYATPINHVPGSPDRETFFSTILSMTEQTHDNHWKRKQKRSLAYRPEEVDSHADVMEAVASTSGNIGYVDASMVDDSVKVLMLIKTRGNNYDGKVVASK